MSSELELPVIGHAAEIARHLRDQRRLVLVAETGSGKTTQVPRIIHESGVAGKGRIIVLQPRRLAARSVARRVASEMGGSLGGLVGFRTRYERAESRDTRVLFVTDGLFVRMAQSDPLLTGVSAVVLDEFHERSIATDLAAGLVRRLQATARRDLCSVVMSATLDAARLGEVFGCEPLAVLGRLHPVDVKYLGDSRQGEDIAARAAAAVVEALRQTQGDALVFMPGRREIEWTIEALAARLPSESFDLCALHGSQRAEDQDRALLSTGRRKIVVATNIAETSLTIPGVTIVVDSGLARVHRFDPRRDINSLRVEPISQASARQRAGRAGRVAPGLCLRLWSEGAELKRAKFDTPEIQRIDLSEPLLVLASLGLNQSEEFPWVDAPAGESVDRGTRVLVACGALDERRRLTEVGRKMARIPAHPRIARALVEAARRGCVGRAALWAAMISERDFAERADPQWLRRQFHAGDLPGDLLARERAIEARERGGRGSELDSEAVREVLRAASDLERATRNAAGDDIAPAEHETDDEALAACFLVGFPDRVAWRLDRHRLHAAMGNRRRVSIDRRSLHEGSGPLIAFEVDHTGSGDSAETTLSMTVALKPGWVEATLPHRFTTRVEERWNEEAQAVEEFEERLFDSTVIESTRRPPRDLAAASLVLADRMAAGDLVPDDWEEQSCPWIDRVRWVARAFPERRLIEYTPEERKLLFAEVAEGAARWSQVRSRPTREAMANALSYEDRQFVEKMAPSSLRLPGGFSMKIDYSNPEGPRGKAKIQDFYGVEETPRVGGGRMPVLLEILGPNYRPLQVTADLSGFWKVLYPQLRNELKRRYPRHKWL